MSGPCSLPFGPKSEWVAQNEITCNLHFNCWPENPAGREDAKHEWVTLRVWLSNRNRLVTGKT